MFGKNIRKEEIPVGRNITGWPDTFEKTNELFVPCQIPQSKSRRKMETQTQH